MRIFSMLLAVWVLAFAAPAAAQAPPVEAYGRLPAVSDVAISPNGQRLAIAGFDGQRSVLRVLNADTGQTERVSAVPDGTKLRGVAWADDERLLFYVSATVDFRTVTPAQYRAWGVRLRGSQSIVEYWRVGVMSLTNDRVHYLSVDEDLNWMFFGQTYLIAPIEGDPGAGRMISWGLDGKLGVFRVQLDSGRSRAVSFGSLETNDIILNAAGGTGARVDVNEDTNRWSIYSYADPGSPQRLREGDSEWGDAPTLWGFLADGDIVVGERTNNFHRLFAMDPRSGEMTPIAENPRYDVRSPISDPWSHLVVGARWTEDMPRQGFFHEDLESVRERLAAHFADTYAQIITWSRDRRRFVVWAETNHDAGAYYLYEPGANSMRVIARPYPELTTEAALGVRQAIQYPARDRTRIPAYLTLPAGAEPRNLPLVLLVHGGPHARDAFTFDWWASFLASRGYAVLQPNYRGSTGYGYTWFDAGRGNWGDGVMQTDVEDGVEALVRAGMVDPQRVCIVGGSYGGYAALAGATLTPERYRCAASIAGVSDLMMMLTETVNTSGSTRSASSDWWRLSIGDRRADREHLLAISPANRADQVRAPILLLHGLDDTVVPVAQSRRMRDALRAAGKDVRYVEMAGDDHWLSNAETRTQMLRELETFLGQHLGAP